ncbi:MAG: 16S rRNA (uracil(1498)-N(3))-methyltransferase [Nitrospinae bacterium]|nr:16S rRNA (uracil(1498)-N(3))-methyltransferase [Nitrospinota bacterium]
MTKKLRRFFVLPEQAREGRIFFNPEETIRIRNVLRLRQGDMVAVLDNRGMEREVELASLSKGGAIGSILKETRHGAPSSPRLGLALALPAPPRMDWIVQKSTELGLDEILPFTSRRSVRLSTGKNRMDRWKKVAKEASEQSRRVYIPDVKEAVPFSSFFKSQEEGSLKILLWEKEKDRSLRSVLENTDLRGLHSLLAAIGPEGGFEDEEAENARNAGFLPVGLGQEILRVETAALAVLSVIQYSLGRLG